MRVSDSGVGSEKFAAVAQPVERVLGKDEVMGSSPISSFDLDGDWRTKSGFLAVELLPGS